MEPSEQLHLDAARYATTRREKYDEAVKADRADRRTLEQEQGIWLAHYEGYKEGWTARQEGIDTLHALYEQASRQRDELMAQQEATILAMRGKRVQ